MESVRICDLDVLRISMDEAVKLVENRAKLGDGGWLALVNLEMIARSKKDSAYASVLKSADIIIADGMPIVWAAKKIGKPLPERVAGVDLTKNLLADSLDLRISIIGGENPELALQKTGVTNTDRFQIFTGKVPSGNEGVSQIAEILSAHNPQIVFLALGVGKQDFLADKLRKQFPHAMFLGVGGSFEMIGEMKKRAPKWMQNVGMEWLFRLCIEPGRLWKRYLVNYPPGAVHLMKSVRAERRKLTNAS